MSHRRKNRWLAGFLAFLVPGAGHLYTGAYSRGLLILTAVLLDMAALIRFSDSTGGNRALLLVYLGLGLPALYFISVFDALQSALRTSRPGQDQGERITLWQGVILVLGGIVLIFLIRQTTAVQPKLDVIGNYASSSVPLLLGIVLLWNRRKGVFRLGRWSAATVILFTGGLLLWDQLRWRNDISILGNWWPAIVVLLGLEIISYSLLKRRNIVKLVLDVTGIFIAILISFTAFTITQYGSLPFRWLDQYAGSAGIDLVGEEKGVQYTKDTVTAVINDRSKPLRSIVIKNINGAVTVEHGNGSEVSVRAVVWVDLNNKQEADEIAEQSGVSIQSGSDMMIETSGKPYGANGEHKPRINIVVSIPENPLKMDVSAARGLVTIRDFSLYGGLDVSNVSGGMELSRLTGKVNAHTVTGDVRIDTLDGNAAVLIKDGSVRAAHVKGDITATTSNGNIELLNINGSSEAQTKNGKITITNALGNIQADTLNGAIDIASFAVGGSWDVSSSVGDIHLQVPRDGNFTVYGSVTFGSIRSNLPLSINNRAIYGTIGNGTNRISVNANSDIAINEYKQEQDQD